ncbi:hypothetical protein LTR36_001496 [Oleoguttula mirabilis]|uniref:Uncharacterized protein n=1 Tax=Oleoguttula mirabilis TaxID=1507867 RepID=A0AAV9JNQ3_9PEZI|nr:hypothetical protein LTR36_001496 [Oleoguttula mirabilis]
MATTYWISAKDGTTQRDLERLRRTLTDICYGQIARYAAGNYAEYGVEVTCTDIFSMTLSISLPAKHDAWLPKVVRTLEYVGKVEKEGAEDAARQADDMAVDPPPYPVFPLRTSIGSGGGSASNQNQSALLRLPGELRESIYRHCSEGNPQISDAVGVLKIGGRVPGLFFACQQLYCEALPMAYALRLRTIAATVTGSETQSRIYPALGGLRKARDMFSRETHQ